MCLTCFAITPYVRYTDAGRSQLKIYLRIIRMYDNRGSFWSSMPPVTKHLIILNVIIWVALMIFPESFADKVLNFAGLHYFRASDFNVAQLVTYMFMHDTRTIAHLFFNMFTLFMFGITLERVLGGKRYLFYYLSCGIGAALIQEAVWAIMAPGMVEKTLANLYGVSYQQMGEAIDKVNAGINVGNVRENLELVYNRYFVTIGASGAIYGILLAFGLLFPNRPLYLMFIPIPIKAKWMVIGYGAIEIALGLSTANDGVAHFAHLGGMIFGFLLIYYWKHNGTLPRHGYY